VSALRAWLAHNQRGGVRRRTALIATLRPQSERYAGARRFFHSALCTRLAAW
jgi:hypothetical protein